MPIIPQKNHEEYKEEIRTKKDTQKNLHKKFPKLFPIHACLRTFIQVITYWGGQMGEKMKNKVKKCEECSQDQLTMTII